MKRLAPLLALVLGALLLPGGVASAENSVRLSRSSALIGEHLEMTVQVTAPAGATVELTPGTPSWGNIELVSLESVNHVNNSDGVVWVLQATIAAFAPGNFAFAPTVSVVQGSEAQSFELPPTSLAVVRTLAEDAPLELSPLPEAVGIEGAESPWLKPGIALGVVAGASVLSLVLWFAGRAALRRARRKSPLAVPREIPRTLEGAAELLHSDPVGAYRMMSSVVKTELARRYGVRATALTTTELRRRLESGGERWEARLVSGLLEECDSVIYAGYRPAAERREADLTMAREIVEVAG